MRKSIYILCGIIIFFQVNVSAQKTNNLPQSQSNNSGKPSNSRDTVPQKPRYTIIDSVKPSPIETRTFVSSTLRTNNIFPNRDVMELIGLLNPGIYNNDSIMSDHKLILPNFPEPYHKTAKTIDKAFRDDLHSDDHTNNAFAASARRLDTLANLFNAKKFGLENENTGSKYEIIKNYLPALADLTIQSINKIKHTSRKTVSTLDNETTALNNLLLKYNNESTLTENNINDVYSLMVDMSILLHLITGRKLDVLTQNNLYHYQFLFSNASFTLNKIKENKESPLYDDDDPRKFNIYVFRKSLVEGTGKRDPEMDIYTVSYVIPALENDPDEWSTLPDPASTVHCYFAPARFKFILTDGRTGAKYAASEDLFDSEKDPSEKWSLINLFRPTYKLVFLIP